MERTSSLTKLYGEKKSGRQRFLNYLADWGFDFRRSVGRLHASHSLRLEKREFQRLSAGRRYETSFPMARNFPIWDEKSKTAGQASGHYFHQDLLAARDIYTRDPQRHVDVGSSIYGFVSHVASFREVEVLDIRPVDSEVDGIVFHQVDVMNLSMDWRNSTDSLSCLHALEHFGLGRYGDDLDPGGWLTGLEALSEMVRPGGRLYLSVPTSSVQRIEFNAHRVFSIPFLREHLEPNFHVSNLAFVLDSGRLVANVELDSAAAMASFDAWYGCSIWFLDRK